MYPASPNKETAGTMTAPPSYVALPEHMANSSAPGAPENLHKGVGNAQNIGGKYIAGHVEYGRTFGHEMSTTPNRGRQTTGSYMQPIVAPVYRVHPPSPQPQSVQQRPSSGAVVLGSHPTTPSYSISSTAPESSPYMSQSEHLSLQAKTQHGYPVAAGALPARRKSLSPYSGSNQVQDLLTPQSLYHNRSLGQLSSDGRNGPLSDHGLHLMHPASGMYSSQSPSLVMTPADYPSQSPSGHGVGMAPEGPHITVSSMPHTGNGHAGDPGPVSALGIVPGSQLATNTYDVDRISHMGSQPYRRGSTHASIGQTNALPPPHSGDIVQHRYHQNSPQQHQIAPGVSYSVPTYVQQPHMAASTGMGSMSTYAVVVDAPPHQHVQLPNMQHQSQQHMNSDTGSGNRSSSLKSQRRVEQNRRAQRAFRDRKRKYVESLQKKADDLEGQMDLVQHLRAENMALTSLVRLLKAQVCKLETKPELQESEITQFITSYCAEYISTNNTKNTRNGREHDLSSSSSLTGAYPQNSSLSSSAVSEVGLGSVPSSAEHSKTEVSAKPES